MRDPGAIAGIDAIGDFEPIRLFPEWAEQFLEFEGRRFAFRPAQRQPARDLFNSQIRSVTIRACSGWGKTVLMAAGIGYGIDELGLQIGLMYPSGDIAQERLSAKYWPFFSLSPRLKRLKMAKGRRGDHDLAADKKWLNGARLQAVGANSPGKIRVLEVDLAYADEIDSLTEEKTDEGDKLAQFYKRTRNRAQQFHWATSFPSRRGFSKIDALFDKSDGCRWIVPCAHCSEWFEMHTNLITYPKKKPAAAELVCPECGRGVDDKQRHEMATNGKFRDRWGNDIIEGKFSAEFAGDRGYHVGCLAHVGEHADWANGYLHEVASEMQDIDAAENPEKQRQVFVTTMDAESFLPATEAKPETSGLYERREPYRASVELPAGVLVIVAGADVQGNRLEWEIVGFGANEESWGLAYGITSGSPLSDETWQMFERQVVNSSWTHPSGAKIKPAAIGIDSGYFQDRILNFCRVHPTAHALKGSRDLGKTIVGTVSRVGPSKISQIQIGTNEAKDIIYRQLLINQTEEERRAGVFPRGYMHFPNSDDYGPNAGGDATGYFEMLTAEDGRMRRDRSGEWVVAYENLLRKRNEALDARVYALAMAKKLNPNYEIIAGKYGEKPTEKLETRPYNLQTRNRSNNFATNW